jgi:hypothetical protein
VKLNPGFPWKSSIYQEDGSFHQQNYLNLRKKMVKCYIWKRVLHDFESLTLRKIDKK